jgi:isocitrate dehydrogenase kinase/phosphatase
LCTVRHIVDCSFFDLILPIDLRQLDLICRQRFEWADRTRCRRAQHVRVDHGRAHVTMAQEFLCCTWMCKCRDRREAMERRIRRMSTPESRRCVANECRSVWAVTFLSRTSDRSREVPNGGNYLLRSGSKRSALRHTHTRRLLHTVHPDTGTQVLADQPQHPLILHALR